MACFGEEAELNKIAIIKEGSSEVGNTDASKGKKLMFLIYQSLIHKTDKRIWNIIQLLIIFNILRVVGLKKPSPYLKSKLKHRTLG